MVSDIPRRLDNAIADIQPMLDVAITIVLRRISRF